MRDFEEGVSFFLPAKHEGSHIEKTLTELYEAISGQSYAFEMICIDDGSDDGTFEGMSRFAEGKPEVILKRFDVNIGLGKSARWGMSGVRYDYMMWVPTNGIMDPLSLFDKFDDRSEDSLLIFNVDGMEIRPLHRKIISKTYNLLMTRYFAIDVEYVHPMLLLPSRRVVIDDSRADRSFFIVELLVLALRKWGLRPLQAGRCRVRRSEGINKTKSFTWRNVREMLPAMRDLKRRLGEA